MPLPNVHHCRHTRLESLHPAFYWTMRVLWSWLPPLRLRSLLACKIGGGVVRPGGLEPERKALSDTSASLSLAATMIRGLVRTSYACRTALDIAYAAPGRAKAAPAWSASPVLHRSPSVEADFQQDSTPVADSSQRAPDGGASIPQATIGNEAAHAVEHLSLLGQAEPRQGTTAEHLDNAPERRHSALEIAHEASSPKTHMRASSVPSSRFGRLFQYGGEFWQYRKRSWLSLRLWKVSPSA